MTTETMTLDLLEKLVKSLSEPHNVERDEDSSAVQFGFRDKDGDSVGCQVRLLNEENAVGQLVLPFPESYKVSAMIVSNLYNCKARGVFAYVQPLGDDKWCVVLETNIITRGGVCENMIRHQLRLWIEQINDFESTFIEGIKELGEDSDFLKGGFWDAIGGFAGGFWRGLSF